MKTRKILLVTVAFAALTSSMPVFASEPQGKAETEHGWHHHHCQSALWHLLPEEKRTLLRSTMEKIHKENASLREQGRKLDKELDALLKVQEFDKSTFLAKQAQLDAIHDKMKAKAEQELASIAADFTQEERKILAEMRNMRHHHWKQGEHEKKTEDSSNG